VTPPRCPSWSSSTGPRTATEQGSRAPRIAALLVGLAVLVGALVLFGSSEPIAAPVDTGASAPGFRLPELGTEGELSLAELRGKVVFLNFWATWCKPCEDEMPAMERLYQRFRADGLEMLAVSVDVGDEEVLAFRERLGLSFRILHDPDREVTSRYQSFRFPETYLIDAEGVVVGRFIGPRDWDSPAYQDAVLRLLESEDAPRVR